MRAKIACLNPAAIVVGSHRQVFSQPNLPLLLVAFGIYFSLTKSINNKEIVMSKPGRKIKKANHGKRPANAKARKAKRKKIKTP